MAKCYEREKRALSIYFHNYLAEKTKNKIIATTVVEISRMDKLNQRIVRAEYLYNDPDNAMFNFFMNDFFFSFHSGIMY